MVTVEELRVVFRGENAQLLRAIAESERQAKQLSGALRNVGVDLAGFSPAFQAAARAQADVFDQAQTAVDPLTMRLVEFGQAEQGVVGHLLRASQAMRDQAAVTAHKDETTEQFTQRLRALGFTEREVAERIDETGRSLRAQATITEASTEVVGASTATLTQSIAGMTNMLGHAMGVLTRFDLIELTVQGSTDRLRQAQENLSKTIREYGEESEQAVAATEELDRAQTAYEKTQLRANLSTIAAIGQVAALAAQAPAAIRSLQGVAAAAALAAGGMTAFQIAATFGLAAVGIVAGLVLAEEGLRRVGAEADSAAGRIDHLAATVRAREKDLRPQVQVVPTIDALPALRQVLDALRDSPINLGGFLGQSIRDAKEAIDDLKIQEHGQKVDDLTGQIERAGLAHERLRERIDRVREGLDPLGVLFERVRADAALVGPAFQASMEQAISSITAGRQALAQWEGTRSVWQQMADDVAVATEALRDFQDVGVNLAAFSPAFQAAMQARADSFIRANAVVDLLTGKITNLGALERNFTKDVLSTSQAMRDQAHITKFKDETTEQFTERLKELGFTEEEITARINEAGDALLSQAEATNAATDAAGGPMDTEGSGPGSGPGSALGARTIATIVRQRKSDAGVMAIYEEIQFYLREHPEKIGNPKVQQALAAFQRMFEMMARGTVNTPVQGWAGMALQLAQRVYAARLGANFVADRDGLLMYHARERIMVDPAPRDGPPGTGSTVVYMPVQLVINGDADRRDIDDALRAHRSLLERRLASRGTR